MFKVLLGLFLGITALSAVVFYYSDDELKEYREHLRKCLDLTKRDN